MPPTTPMEAISFPLEIFSSTTYYLVKLTTPVVSQHLCLSEFHPVSLSVCLFVLISFICLLIALYRFVCLSVIKLPYLFCFVIISITMFNASISVYLFYFSFVVRFCWSLCYVSVFVSLFTSVTIFSPQPLSLYLYHSCLPTYQLNLQSQYLSLSIICVSSTLSHTKRYLSYISITLSLSYVIVHCIFFIFYFIVYQHRYLCYSVSISLSQVPSSSCSWLAHALTAPFNGAARVEN